MAAARRGDLVQIHNVILSPEARPDSLPDSTKQVAFEGWIKGFLEDDIADIDQTVNITTFIGRTLSGRLVEVAPGYDHNFGRPRPELLTIGRELSNHMLKS